MTFAEMVAAVRERAAPDRADIATWTDDDVRAALDAAYEGILQTAPRDAALTEEQEILILSTALAIVVKAPVVA